MRLVVFILNQTMHHKISLEMMSSSLGGKACCDFSLNCDISSDLRGEALQPAEANIKCEKLEET